jgi:mono/diheme cytochrome c family protein
MNMASGLGRPSTKAAFTVVPAFALIVAATWWIPSSAAQTPAADVARGKYLVEKVARCGDCHSPKNEKGEPLAGKELRGAPLFFKPNAPVPDWADKAPNIAGLRAWETSDAVKFLITGIAYNDLPLRPPMPQYHMNKEDAEAIVAYLKSLSPVAK